MKKLIVSIKENYKLVIAVLIAGLFIGWLAFHPTKQDLIVENQIEGHEGHNHTAEDPTTWTCSMHPQIKQDKPGQCPICAMDLIPLTTNTVVGDDIDPDEIALSESAAKLADIQTMSVTRGTPENSIYLQGKVKADERNIAELTARFGGRIEKLFVNFTGQLVRKGEKLATIYSPDLVTAQRELIEAITFKESRPSLYTASKAKLKLWDLTDAQIKAIEENGEPQLYFDILSPITGTVMMRHISLGDYVKEGSALFQVTDLSRVWVMFDAYESDLPWIKNNDHMEVTIQALPGNSFDGKVSFIDPFINAVTRVANVRIELANPGLRLKPEMFANGILHSKVAESTDELLVPKSSILWTGKRAVVYVKVADRESPSFLYREVTLGPDAGNFYVIIDGLSEGEEIAVNGVFKIDAAAQLEGKPSMMNPTGGAGSTPHDMSKMNMGGDSKTNKKDDVSQMVSKSDKRAVAMKFKMQLQEVFTSYSHMTDAFILTDSVEISKGAKKVKSDLGNMDMSLLKGDAHMEWMDQLSILNKEIEEIQKSGSIEKQRISYALFNDAFYKSIKTFGIDSGTVYYQYCPMANGGEGAFWFSKIKDIKNPYFGEAMLTCGETKETFKY